MMRRYGNYWARFSQPDPWDGSYVVTDPQSFNRYAYVQNDPVNFTDPTGLDGKPGDLCPGGVIGNDGKCHAGPVVTVNSLPPDPFWDQFKADYSKSLDLSWMFQPLRAPEPNVGPLRSLHDRDVARRIAEGQAWDKWQAWVNCNTPIMNKYNGQLNEFHRIGGTAFSWEVGAGFGVFTAGFGAGVASEYDPLPLGGGPVIGILSSVLITANVIRREREAVNKLISDYHAEVRKTCGAKPPHP